MNKKEIQDKSSFLLSEYKACLNNGLIETPEQFLIRMDVEPQVANNVRPNLNQMKDFFDKNIANK